MNKPEPLKAADGTVLAECEDFGYGDRNVKFYMTAFSGDLIFLCKWLLTAQVWIDEGDKLYPRLKTK